MKYEVTIQATITKTYTIDAPNEDEAIQAANDDFDVNTIEHTYENYEQDTIDVQLIEEQTSWDATTQEKIHGGRTMDRAYHLPESATNAETQSYPNTTQGYWVTTPKQILTNKLKKIEMIVLTDPHQIEG